MLISTPYLRPTLITNIAPEADVDADHDLHSSLDPDPAQNPDPDQHAAFRVDVGSDAGGATAQAPAEHRDQEEETGLGEPVNPAYYQDVKTGKRFTAEATLIPPITSPDGNEAVKVHLFTCDRNDPAKMFVGYYEKYTPEAKQILDQAGDEGMSQVMMEDDVAKGQMFSPDGKAWTSISDEETYENFNEILLERLKCSDGRRAVYCRARSD